MASVVHGMQPVGDGQARSSVMAALIDQADAKRRCVEVVPSTFFESCVRNALHGLRGVRVGEASNPGPPQTRIRPRVDVAEDILVSLEHDLTHIDSDDEPLVSVGSDRNVVPRLFHRSPASVIEDVGIKSIALDSVVSMSAPAHSIPTQVDREDASSVSSESCWGEMEDLGEDNVEWGLLPCPAAPAVQNPKTWMLWSVIFSICMDPPATMWRCASQVRTKMLRRSQVHVRVIVVVLQKWWSSVNGDPGDCACSLQVPSHHSFSKAGRASLSSSHPQRQPCSRIHGGQFK